MGTSTRHRYSNALLIASLGATIASTFAPQQARAQTSRPPFTFSAAVGVGGLSGAKSVFQAAAGGFIRAAIGLRRLEISAMHEDNLNNFLVRSSEYACSSTSACPVNYRIDGVAAGVWINDAVPRRGSSRLQVGTGVYRIHPDHPYQLPAESITAAGAYLGGESKLYSGEMNSVALAARFIVLPNVRGERLWVVPIELTVTFW